MRTAMVALLAAGALAFGQDTPTGKGLSGSALIDHWVRAKWGQLEMKPEARADDAEYLRRVCLDVIGTIPSLDRAEKFLADKSPDKRAKLVEELLAGEAYAENWAEIWAGILVGYDQEGRQALGPVIRELKEPFAKNLPFDAFARSVMTAQGETPQRAQAGEMMGGADEEAQNGLAYFYYRYQKSAGRELPMALAGKFSRTFLGTQIQCAQCHDHPFDVWTQEDFYGMAAFFTELRVNRVPIDGMKDDEKKKKEEYKLVVGDPSKGRRSRGLVVPDWKGGPIKPAFLETKAEPRDADGSLRASFARLMTEKDNLQFARATVNRYWGHFFGRGIVNPVDEFNGRNKPTHPELLDALAKDLVAHAFDIKWLIKAIAGSQAYQVSSKSKKRDAESEKYHRVAAVRALTPEQILHSVVTALAGDAAGARDLRNDRAVRGALQQFRYAFGDDEGAETVEFEGTIPGALLMMNGEIIAAGLQAAGRRGLQTRLGQILKERKSVAERVRDIYVAALSRPPSESEQTRAGGYITSRGGQTTAYEDLMWSLLNSSEFLFNH